MRPLSNLPTAGASDRSLVLDLSLRGDKLVACLSPAGAALGPVRTVSERPFSLERTSTLHRRIVGVLGQANRWGDMDRGSLDTLRTLGALLFDELLPRSVKAAIRAANTGQLQLVIDQTLVFVPWELMHHGDEFLGLAFGIGRIVRTPKAVRGPARRPPDERWRMLILCDPRGDLMGSYYEGVSLRDELDAQRRRLAVDLRASRVSVDDVRELIREYDVVHYAGHATHDSDDPANTGWLLTDGTLTAEAVADLAGGHPFPRLVFANACRSVLADDRTAPQSVDAAVSSERQAMVHGLADSMLLAGVQHYVGTLWDVPDEPACHFSLAMYQALLAGSRIGEALRLARLSLVERYGEDSVLWASYVMYGTATARYFEQRHRASSRAATRASGTPTAHPTRVSDRALHRPAPRAHATRVRGAITALPFRLSDGVATPARRHWGRWVLAAVMAAFLTAAGAAVLSLSGPQAPPTPGWSAGGQLPSSGPELYPAPLPSSSRPPGAQAAPAAAVPPDAAFQPRIRLMVQQPSAPLGAPNAKLATATGAILNSWDHFQVHMKLNRPAFAAVWHVESDGTLRRVFPEDDATAVSEVPSVAWTELPGRDAWYYLDDSRGKEMFILAASEHDELDEDDLIDALRPLQQRLQKLRQSPARGGSTGLKDRVITDDRTVLKAIVATFKDYFDAASTIEFEHR